MPQQPIEGEGSFEIEEGIDQDLNDEIDDILSLSVNFDEAVEDMVSILNGQLSPTGCWSDFNRVHRLWRQLRALSQQSPNVSFYRPEDLPPEPSPDDFSNNDC